MRGSIIKRGNRYSVVLDLGRDPVSGKRKRDWHSGFLTRQDAEAAQIDLLWRFQKGTYISRSRQVLGEFLLQTWLPAAKPTVRASTFQSYEHNTLKHVVPRIGGIALQDVTPAMLNIMYSELLANGRLDGRGGLAPKTVHYIHTILHRAFRDACKWNLLARNPATSADPPKPTAARDMKTWSASELNTFLDQLKGTRVYPVMLVLATTGMRRGEVLGLRWADVDLDLKTVAIQQTVISVAYNVQYSKPKTER